jgi:hypothetical protein
MQGIDFILYIFTLATKISEASENRFEVDSSS